jgi:hypothetical protein
MRILRYCDWPLLEAILEQSDFELEELSVSWFGSFRPDYDRDKPWNALVSGKGLPCLRRLELGDEGVDLERFKELVSSPLVERLELLGILPSAPMAFTWPRVPVPLPPSFWDPYIEPMIEVMRALPASAKFELRVFAAVLHARVQGAPPEIERERYARHPPLVLRRSASGDYEKV